jgi:hypothetical protein
LYQNREEWRSEKVEQMSDRPRVSPTKPLLPFYMGEGKVMAFICFLTGFFNYKQVPIIYK